MRAICCTIGVLYNMPPLPPHLACFFTQMYSYCCIAVLLHCCTVVLLYCYTLHAQVAYADSRYTEALGRTRPGHSKLSVSSGASAAPLSDEDKAVLEDQDAAWAAVSLDMVSAVNHHCHAYIISTFKGAYRTFFLECKMVDDYFYSFTGSRILFKRS